MNGQFWADLDAARRAIEHATAGIDVSQMLTAAEAVKRMGPSDFKMLSSTLALAEGAQRQFERLTGNFDMFAARSKCTGAFAAIGKYNCPQCKATY